MQQEILSSALLHSIGRTLSVPDLVRTAETLKASGQLGSIEVLYDGWVQHNGNHPLLAAVLFNQSVVLTEAGKLLEAKTCLERAIERSPDFLPAYINLGRVWERLGQTGLALVQWSAALARTSQVTGTVVSHKVTTLNQCGRALEAAGHDAEAEAMLQQSLELDPHQPEPIQHLVALRQRQCSWPAVSPSERVSRDTLLRGLSPLSAAALTDDPLFHLALAAHYNRTEVGTPSTPLRAWPVAAAHEGPLRIGYLSSDLREHAVGYLMTDVFSSHDRSAVEVFAYYSGPPGAGPMQTHFQQTCDHWRDLTQLDDRAAAQRIAEDGIQILVDLNGYTREGRLKLVAQRPAPVIVNWLGYPGTMGSPWHHYIVADDTIIPPSHELYYSEAVRRVPCYQPSAKVRTVAPTPTRQDVGLPDGAFVFCCFNGSHKLHRLAFDRWLAILAQVPSSVLWLLSSTAVAHAQVRSYAASQGVAPERIIFADKLANPQHLARYPLADLFLDSSPYGAHTTASDALWMGLPVLTWTGHAIASRVCASLLHAVNLPELVCSSGEEFVRTGVALANDPAKLAAYRAQLAETRESCTLFDVPKLTKALEGHFASMWEAYRRGTLPRPHLANLDAYLEVGLAFSPEEQEHGDQSAYHAWWLERLAAHHHARPLGPDPRMVALAPDLFG